jgi:8-oxo-dGTP diphosphatase
LGINAVILRGKKILTINMDITNTFFKSAFSVDNVIFGFDEGDLKILLIKRGSERGSDIYKDMWALPGDLVNPEEDLESAAARVLKELTGLSNVYLDQVHTFGAVGRHPLGRVITVAYFSLIKISDYNTLRPASFAEQVAWHSVAKVEDLAFDHNQILQASFDKLKRWVRVRPIGFELLPPKFTLTALLHLYEAIFPPMDPKRGIDKRNFRKKILAMGILLDCEEMQEGVAHRPARLYQFDKEKYDKLVESGFSFEI